MTEHQHLHTHIDDQGLFWLGVQVAGSSTNALSAPVLEELLAVCRQLPPHARGLILHSNTPGHFSSGLDSALLANIQPQELQTLIGLGQQLSIALENLPIPTIALLEGHCFGAGLELALAVDYRIVADTPPLQLGFPDTQHGTHPLFGGMARAVSLLGMRNAMALLLDAHPLSAAEALAYHLVDACVDRAELHQTARHYLHHKPGKTRPSASNRLLNHPAARLLLASQLRGQLVQKQLPPTHYPAPHTIVSLWQKYGSDPQAMQAASTASLAALLQDERTQNQLKLHRSRQQLHALGDPSDFRPQHAHIIGAGHLGRDIAAWCALHGLRVTLQDINPDTIPFALARADALFAERFPDHPALALAARQRIQIDPKGHEMGVADVVIEAIPDRLANKQELFAHLEESARPDALIATTSTILPLERLAAVLLRPERLIGLHFLYPLPRMGLVEVSHAGGLTDPAYLNAACAFVVQLHKLPLPLRSTPGLLVNRILLTYITQGIRLHQQNVPHTILDKAGRDFGMPFGPLELADMLGLDYCRQLGDALAKNTAITVPDLLVDMVNGGKLGCKNGAGFYRYRNGRMLKPDRAVWDGDTGALQEKLISQMSEEAAVCLEQGLVETPELLDAAVVFGAGFPAFRGGPLLHARVQRK